MELRGYIENIEDEELIEVSRCIYARKADKFRNFLPAERSGDLNAILFQEIDNFPAILINKILKYRNYILKNEIETPSEDLEVIISTIIRLSSVYKSEIQFSIVQDGIINPKINPDLKLKLALYLSNFDSISKEYFQNLIKEDIFLFPALFNKIKYSHPFEGLKLLEQNIDQINTKIIKPNLRNLITNLLSIDYLENQDNYKMFYFFLASCNTKTVALINEVIDSDSLKGIKDKIIQYRTAYEDSSKLKVPFSLTELGVAEDLITNAIKYKKIEIKNDVKVNMDALTFVIKDYLNKWDLNDILSKLGEAFLKFDMHYKDQFHVYLSKQEIQYDPTNHIVLFKGQPFKFIIEKRSFRENQKKLSKANHRQESIELFQNYE